ncbi:MAG: rhodanese-like domain-containing protein [Anaerolineales bacterium]|nr:rhodanese-like domain-containing protein [Anaerolineales bacterium]MBX3036434.1 rhodanese-like domain-containing protein [Anaerolineales bacterium]
MKNKKFLFAFSILILATLACNATLPSNDVSTLPTAPFNPQIQSDVPRTENDVPRISIIEAKAAVESGEAIFVDVRSAQSYAELHAKDAISIPLDVFEANINSVALEKTDWIITYCT